MFYLTVKDNYFKEEKQNSKSLQAMDDSGRNAIH